MNGVIAADLNTGNKLKTSFQLRLLRSVHARAWTAFDSCFSLSDGRPCELVFEHHL